MTVSFVVLILVVDGVFSALLAAIVRHRETDRMSAHSTEMLVAEQEVEQHLLDLDRAERGFIATKDPSLLKASTQEQAALTDTSARLERLAHTPDEARQARQVAQHSQSYVRDCATPMLQAAQRGDPAAHSAATAHEDERRVAELRAELDRLIASESRVAAGQDTHAQAAGSRAVTEGVAGMAGAVLVAVILVGYLAMAVVRPVRRATVMAGHLARGELDTRCPETGAGEVGALTRSFNTMADAVRQRVRDLVRMARAQTAMRRIATRVARGAAPAEVLDVIATELGDLIGSDATHIVRYEADGTATVIGAWQAADIELPVGTRLPLDGRSVTATVRQTGRPARMDSYADAPGPIATHLRRHHVRGAVGAPILLEGRLWGALNATATRQQPLALDAAARLADCTDLIATAITNTQAHTDLAASRVRTVVAADQARRQIERNLHDRIQQLIAIAIETGGTASDIPSEMAQLRRRVSAVTDNLNAVVDDLREVSHGIHPTLLSDLGLRPALKRLARRSHIPVDFDVRLDRPLPEPVEMTAYHIAAEALTNAARHAHASQVRLQVTLGEGRLLLTVRDDGIGGADPARDPGLLALTDRVNALGGTITVSSPPSQGTAIHAELPLDLPLERPQPTTPPPDSGTGR
ncbi:HAMP domain-containing protein [Dactylosporangium sp. AC04546]|uniref:HAMP domain-containing protein n=1 Tax=Dactylosporangium sp. AC04546 TaxID=2862460 RepID=UPI002E7BDABC|nr:HAMP domain-containing protein [Dactylosporangium sp. AC04546]WVK80580.1 HAMP domain-containing protein [Dactylosporangium sp. AC04546]